MKRPDDRYVAELPSGLIKNPKLHNAGEDFWVNDVVWLDDNIVRPLYDESHEMYGVVAAGGVKGGKVMVAT